MAVCYEGETAKSELHMVPTLDFFLSGAFSALPIQIEHNYVLYLHSLHAKQAETLKKIISFLSLFILIRPPLVELNCLQITYPLLNVKLL